MLEATSERLLESESRPLDDHVIDFLVDHDKEEPYLDFKEVISVAKDYPFSELAKDFLAFLNYGGGWVLLGFRDKSRSPVEEDKNWNRQYVPVGLPDDFHIDQADLQTKYGVYLVHPISIEYAEFKRDFGNGERRFAVIFFPPSTEVIKAAKGGAYVDSQGRNHTPFLAGWTLFRRGTQSVRASEAEIEFVQRRVLDTQFKLSVLSGQPDRIKETIFSNMFEVSIADNVLFTGVSRQSLYGFGSADRLPSGYVAKKWDREEVTFEDLSDMRSPLRERMSTDSIKKHDIDSWLVDEDRSRGLIELLNKELWFLARRIGLMKMEAADRYYFPCDGEFLKVSWKPRFRESSELTAARKAYIPALNKTVFVHYAVNAGFDHFEKRVYLGLSPTLILTDDGKTPSTGEKEGAVLTSLLNKRYNQTFLNEVLFWAQQFSEGKGVIGLAHGRVLISCQPVTSTLSVGVLADRPVSDEVPVLSHEGAVT
jgi:hypothetical protein